MLFYIILILEEYCGELEMKLKFYNTLTRKKEDFFPLTEGKAGMYSCGPTVYNYAHIGNLRTYIFNDLLRRALLFNGLELTHVMNITDVGHLSSDADEGEDKMVEGARRENKSVWDIARFYEDAFFNDIQLLNIQKPDIVCRATEHIGEMIEMEKKIQENGYAYFSGGNLYLDTSKIPDYGKLARLQINDLQHGARTDIDPNKKNDTDFVLWFTRSKFGDQEMKWPSPWGSGYPGWHIECCAMSSKYLGEQFDIHTGGIDHIPVHHTNEIAQAEAAFGKRPWVKYWLHGEFLVMDKGKMSKSSGEFLTLQYLIEKGYDPLAFRFLCLGAHYRKQLMFSWEAMEGASQGYRNLRNRIHEIKKNEISYDEDKRKRDYYEKFLKYINDDLNIPKAMALLNDLIRESKLGSVEKLELIEQFDRVLGLKLLEKEENEIPDDVLMLAEEREKARNEKNFELSDRYRDLIREKGYEVRDTRDGQVIEKL
jgi:cysteinyl-tRNA synthetase